MHESSLARQILAAVLERAARERAVLVRAVRGWIAETESLSADSVAFHFGALAVGTIAAGAHLDLEVRRIDARCRACRTMYRPDHHELVLCPGCGSPDGELLGETGIGIDAIEVSLEGPVAPEEVDR